MVKIRETEYLNYGKCLKISNDIVEVYVTIDCGPRIIRYSLKDGKNMMHEDTLRLGCEKGDAFDAYYYKGAAWYSYGGHRLWTSPESLPRTYYPDNEKVEYKINKNSVVFLCGEQIRNNIIMCITLTLDESSSILKIDHEIKNTGAFETKFAAWALSVMAAGGMCVVSHPKRDTHLLSNRAIALWPYAKMNDERIFWGEDFITLTQDKNCTSPFKFGLTNENGYAMYFNHDCMFVKKYIHDLGAEYPDGGMSFEGYTNNQFIEVETLSALKILSPGSSVCHTETWSLFGNIKMPQKNDEKTLGKLAEKYITFIE